jgi:uncharacterized protein YodC (DUF2158 family)
MLKRRPATASLAAMVLCCGLTVAWIGPVVAQPAVSNAESQSLAAPVLRTGDLVRLRSGGALMTVDKVEGDQVICYWSTGYGETRSGTFPIAVLSTSITLRTGRS